MKGACMGRLLNLSRYTVIVGVLAALMLSIAVVFTTAIRAGLLIITTLPKLLDEKSAKLFAITSIEIVDLLLIATVLYLVATGLYELFIERLSLPEWISIRSLSDLKNKLISVVVVVLGVTFLVRVVNWDGSENLLPFGGAIAAVIIALTAFNLVEANAKKMVGKMKSYLTLHEVIKRKDAKAQRR
jgi:uncharacterized membrane protein YqhA